MKKNENVNFEENPYYLLILFIKLKRNQFFLFSQTFEISFNKNVIEISRLLKILSIHYCLLYTSPSPRDRG